MGHSISALLFFFFFFFLNSDSAASAATYLGHHCNNTFLFAPNSTYHHNLISLLSSLISNSNHSTGFYKLSVGDSPDVAHGLFLCRGDFSIEVCQDCVDTASTHLVENCPTKRASIIWYDECLVRYSNTSFFSKISREPSLQLITNTTNISHPGRFRDLVQNSIMETIISAAPGGKSGKKFSVRETSFTASQRIYTMGQCTPDLTPSDCDRCLDVATDRLHYWKSGERVLLPSCLIRFEMTPFSNGTVLSQPPSSRPVMTTLSTQIFISDEKASYLNHSCPNTTTFAPDSTYRFNLKYLLESLRSNANSSTGFYRLSAGKVPFDVAYGLFLCRGDFSIDVCQDCVDTASAYLLKNCPTQKTSIIWYDQCLVRYSDNPIKFEMEPSLQLHSTTDISKPPGEFKILLGKAITETIVSANFDKTGRKFSVRETNFTKSQRLFMMAQCTPDLSIDECARCLDTARNKLKMRKTDERVLFSSCLLRFKQDRPFQSTDTFMQEKGKGKGKISATTIIAIVVSIAVSVVFFIIGYHIITWRAKKRYTQEDNDEDEITNAESLRFDLNTIEVATNSFSTKNKLGEGGFGEVYKGTLSDGQEIAVKRLSKSSGQGGLEFKNEVVLVAKLQHRNLVRLLGFCLERREKILVYEFVPNRSLDYFLFDPEQQGLLDWSSRYMIICGIAKGVLYLHEDSRLRIIHRDLKASNILLDGNMNPKVADFGMARIFGVDQTQGNTSRIVGTYGYMSPEYAMQGQFSVKSDVYSFGVLILEIISGKKNSSFYQEGADDLISYAWKLWRDETPLSLMAPVLMGSYSRNEVIRCIHIAFLCVQEDPSERPPLASICLMLSGHSITLALPQQPTFFHFRGSGINSTTQEGTSDQSTSKSTAMSVDEASITEVRPR